MSPRDVVRRIEEVGVVPVVRAPSADLAVRAAEAALAGGVAVFEITLTVPGALGVIRALAARFAGRAVVGAGTVLSAVDAAACAGEGAAFVVAPGLDAAVVEAAHRAGAAAIPGALTPTEVVAATRAGADLVKIFPCSAVGGPAYLRALRGPLPDVKLLPTGGVGLSNAGEYIRAGAAAVGVGAELVDLAALESGDDRRVTERAAALVDAVARARGVDGRPERGPTTS